MSVRLGLLALLDQGACYGYQLRTELDRRTGSTGPINVGQIYNTLDRLERDKLVRKTGERNCYEITAAGRTEVATWFSSPASGSELVEKLALAVTLPGVDVASLVAIQRAAMNRDRPLPDAPTTAEGAAATIVARADALAAEAESRLLDEVAALVNSGIVPFPLSSELPRRGRPAKVTDQLPD